MKALVTFWEVINGFGPPHTAGSMLNTPSGERDPPTPISLPPPASTVLCSNIENAISRSPYQRSEHHDISCESLSHVYREKRNAAHNFHAAHFYASPIHLAFLTTPLSLSELDFNFLIESTFWDTFVGIFDIFGIARYFVLDISGRGILDTDELY